MRPRWAGVRNFIRLRSGEAERDRVYDPDTHLVSRLDYAMR